MAESTLSLTRDDLRSEVGLKLGYGLDVSGWTPEQIARIDICVRDGLAQFYFPVTQDQKTVYEWSFLTPTATLALADTDQDYDLPDDCDGIIERFIVTAGSSAATVIPVVEMDELLQLSTAEAASNALPRIAAIRPKDTDPTTSASQRYEALFYPTPDGSYTVSYDYPVQVDSIGTTNTYLPGGSSHSQTIVQSCLAVAEQFFTPDEQIHQQTFQARLQASIEYDKRNQATRKNSTWALTEPTYGTWNWFKREVAGYLLGQWNINLLTHSENAQVESLVQRGLKTFYYPPGVQRCWSFLTPTATITVVNGTAAYDLPAGFTGLHGPMTFATAATDHKPLREVSEGELRTSQIKENTDGDPEYVAVRPKTTNGSSAHLYEAVFFPTPDGSTPNITYRYKVSPAVLSSSVTTPYGSDVHAETMRQAMIAHAAEQKEGGNQAEEWQKFQQQLSGSQVADLDIDIEAYSQQPRMQQAER